MICKFQVIDQTTKVEKMDFFSQYDWNLNAISSSANSTQEIPGFLAGFEHIVLVQIFYTARRAEMPSRS